MIREFSRAVRATLTLWLLTAIFYPFTMVVIGQVVFPFQANGSLLTNAQGQVIGSALIGQPFEGDRYFWSRPSTSAYSTGNPDDDTAAVLQTGVSGASNLAPSNPALLERVQGDVERLLQTGMTPAPDLLYTSGSSLDPHISPATARLQSQRVATVRDLALEQLETLIEQNTDRRFLGIFGEPGVNVLKLNLALDAL